jgi:hypothetical protein
MQKQNPSSLTPTSAMPAAARSSIHLNTQAASPGLAKMFETNTRTFACNCPSHKKSESEVPQ